MKGELVVTSEDERDYMDSDDGDDSDSKQPIPRHTSGSQYYSQAEKRAHHNALERKRRDHIKDSFSSLRDALPNIKGEKVASRAQILKKAAEHIVTVKHRNNAHQKDIEELRRQNDTLQQQIQYLEKLKSTGTYITEQSRAQASGYESDSSDTESDHQQRPKRLKCGTSNQLFFKD